MRTIKFRGKRLDNWEWVYGDSMKTQRSTLIVEEFEDDGFRVSIKTGYIVSPESVGQWTGLVDRHGKEIFEGDVVSNGVFKGTVEFTDGGYYPFSSSMGTFYPDECGVIGNIHDNPKLMEVE